MSQERDSSFVLTLPAKPLSLSLSPPHTPSFSVLPSFLPFLYRLPRCSQAPRWGPLCHAGWVCHTCNRRDRQSEEVPHQFQQGGGTERGNPRGCGQEDAGETWQGQRHHLRPNSHEYGEAWTGMVGENQRRSIKYKIKKDQWKTFSFATFPLVIVPTRSCSFIKSARFATVNLPWCITLWAVCLIVCFTFPPGILKTSY